VRRIDDRVANLEFQNALGGHVIPFPDAGMEQTKTRDADRFSTASKLSEGKMQASNAETDHPTSGRSRPQGQDVSQIRAGCKMH
jgi:hypothetical protein